MYSTLLFLGPEIGEKQDAIDQIRESLKSSDGIGRAGGSGGIGAAGGGAAVEEASFYAGETPVSAIVSILRSGSLFADKRLFLIKNAENIKKKDDIENLSSYIIEPQDGTTLILLSDENGIAKPIENAVPPNAKRIFWEMFENRKRDWVAAFFKRQGFSIGEDGIETVLELVENNTDALRRECTRLCQFLSKDAQVGADDVEKWLSHTREESAFTLFSRISCGDLEKSLESLHSLLLAKESPQAILAGLTWCFQKLLDYLFLLENNNAGDFELKKIGLSSQKARKDYEQASRRYSIPAAESCLALTAEYDVLLRSMGGGLEAVLMDRYVCKVIGK
jgi:DNA polymerase-3 subunit delta